MILAVCALAGTFPASSNGNDGRWWWQTAVGVGQQRTRNTVGGARVVGYEQQDLRVSLGLNGYIVHPLVAAFRVDTDLFLSKIDGGSGLDNNRVGLRGELNAFPRSAYPFSLFYHRTNFDFSGLDSGSTSLFRGIPETSTRWGGRLRLRRGLLKGTLAGIEREDLDFLDPAARLEVNNREFLDWGRAGDSSRSRVRLERRYHEFGTVDLSTDDLTLRIENHVSVTPKWRWQLNGDGFRRESSNSVTAARMVNDYRLLNRFLGTVRRQDILEIVLALGLTERSTQSEIGAQSGTVYYRWRPDRAWVVAPFAQYDRQSEKDRVLDSPRAGISASWTGRGPGFDTEVSARTSYGSIRDETVNGTSNDRRLAYGMTASFAHGDSGSLRKSLELEWFHNEFRVRRERIIDLPDLGLSATNLGADDFYRARIDLTRALDSRSIRGWGEWSRQSGTQDAFGSGLERETYRGGGNVTLQGVHLQGDVGQTALKQTTVSAEQRIRFATVIARWKPLRYLTFQAMYRMDRRRFDLFSDIDGTSIESKMILQLGLLSLDMSVYERTEDLVNGGKRTNRTIRWGLTSRFGGWLPIVTGTKRRGVIR